MTPPATGEEVPVPEGERRPIAILADAQSRPLALRETIRMALPEGVLSSWDVVSYYAGRAGWASR